MLVPPPAAEPAPAPAPPFWLSLALIWRTIWNNHIRNKPTPRRARCRHARGEAHLGEPPSVALSTSLTTATFRNHRPQNYQERPDRSRTAAPAPGSAKGHLKSCVGTSWAEGGHGDIELLCEGRCWTKEPNPEIWT